jgi:hypothetical protein
VEFELHMIKANDISLRVALAGEGSLVVRGAGESSRDPKA